MLHYRSLSIADVVVVEFLVPAICDGPEIDMLSGELHEILGRSPSKRMIIDLASVRFLASRGLSLLQSLKKLAETHHGDLLICGLCDQVRQVFRYTHQERFFALHSNRNGALAALGLATPKVTAQPC